MLKLYSIIVENVSVTCKNKIKVFYSGYIPHKVTKYFNLYHCIFTLKIKGKAIFKVSIAPHASIINTMIETPHDASTAVSKKLRKKK